MQILVNTNVKQLSALVPGELFAFNFSGAHALAIKVERTGDFERIAILSAASHPKAPPFHDLLWDDFACLSYGTKWILEPIFDTSNYPGNAAHNDTPGAIYQSARGLFLRLERPMQQGQIERNTLDLGSFKMSGSLPNGAVVIPHWRVWADEAAVTRPDSRPLFQI